MYVPPVALIKILGCAGAGQTRAICRAARTEAADNDNNDELLRTHSRAWCRVKALQAE